MPRLSKSAAFWMAAALIFAVISFAQASESPPVLDEDFLEYLGTVDEEGADWTLFEEPETKPLAKERKPTGPAPENDAKSGSKQK
jgi:hypothetical protein